MYFVAKLDSPSSILIWEVVCETSEKCDTIIIVTSMGSCRECATIRVGLLIAQSLSMKTNTDMKNPSEATALIHSRPHLCDLPLAFRNKAPASSTAGPETETDDAKRLRPRFIIVIGTFHSNSIRILIRLKL